MADSVCRALRDGGLDGENAPSLSIKDTITSPLGFDIFTHVLAQLSSYIVGGKSQSRGLVLVALDRSPSFYVNLLKRRGVDVNSAKQWIQILDCYSDPLGWKVRLGHGTANNVNDGVSGATKLFTNVKDIDTLCSYVLELGKGFVEAGKGRFSVAIDSVSEMLRHAPVSSVASFISKLRSNELVSSVFWLVHEDLHEPKVAAVFDYMSSMIAISEPMVPIPDGERLSLEDLSMQEHNFRKARFSVRLKRRNGRVRLLSEELSIDQSGITFTPILSDNPVTVGGLIPKVQFNLNLSEKEQMDKANVVLPFEHQGTGKPIQIYDGRKSLTEEKNSTPERAIEAPQSNDLSRGQIIYLRDSDDERPDSDEDPDDDLDI